MPPPEAPSRHVMDRLIERATALESAVCVGLDPHLDLLPPGLPGAGDVDRVRRFLLDVVDAVAEVAVAVKPQIAFFEQLGPEGFALYRELIEAAHRRDLLVIGDVKRGDIGSTAAAYARAHLDGPPASTADLVTVNPYLGSDSIRPFLSVARQRSRGLFVLVRTSNPSCAELQDQVVIAEREPLYRVVGRLVERWGADAVGERGYSDVGAVVGATHPEQAAALRAALPRTFFLLPGFGAQGARAADVVQAFDERGSGALVSASRSVLFAWRDRDSSGRGYAEAAAGAAGDMARQIQEALRARFEA